MRNINIVEKEKVTMPDKQSLEKFSQTQHTKYAKQAILEGIVALVPGVIFIVVAVLSANAPAEQFSPGRFNIVKTIFPFILVGYFLFLGYVVYDIHEKVTRK